MPNDIYQWDPYSDQPHVIRGKTARRRLYRLGAIGTLKTALTALLLPLFGIALLFKKRVSPGQKIDTIGICVNIDTVMPEKKALSLTQMQDMLNELEVGHLLIRIPLADIENLDTYTQFIGALKRYRIVVNILQDRRHIENPALLDSSIRNIFDQLHGVVKCYQIGNACNRRKWAFISLDEYFVFFKNVCRIRDEKHPDIKLLGASIIDFELPNAARSLFHGKKLRYDGFASLLYVDRRGAPENKQFGCDLIAKINWLHLMASFSPRAKTELWITETNWPLAGTEPFAPAIGDCMVTEEQQAAFLARYYLLMMASGKVTACFWHQLVAPGYGLIDNRGNEIRKRQAYYAFKQLIRLFKGATINHFQEGSTGMYSLSATNSRGSVKAVWVNGASMMLDIDNDAIAIDITGKPRVTDTDNAIEIGDQVTYILDYSPD